MASQSDNNPIDGISILVSAYCRIGSVQGVKDLIAGGAPVDVCDGRGWYPIHEAAYGNHVDCLAALFETHSEKIDVNWQCYNGASALWLAAHRGHEEAIRFLLDHGADPNLKSLDGWTPLITAVRNGNIHCVEALLDAGANISTCGRDGRTALHEAVSRNHVDVLQLLLSKNADPSVTDAEGVSPATLACYLDRPACLQLLVDSVEDKSRLVNSRDKDGTSCVYVAAREGATSCLEILIQHGADVNVVNQNNAHPIYAAAMCGNLPCVKLLLPLVDKDFLITTSTDPVAISVQHRNLEMLALFLQFGLPADRADEYPHDFAVATYRYLQPLLMKTMATPLADAVFHRHLDSVRLLLQYKSKPTSSDLSIVSPLLLAILKRRSPGILLELLKSNPDLNLISINSVCRVPDAMVVASHPLYRAQLVTMLKAGLDPALEFWCACKRPPSYRMEPSYSFLGELSANLSSQELVDLLNLVLQFSSGGLPNCCHGWSTALGSRMEEFEKWSGQPLPLQQMCRLTIRKCFSTGRLLSNGWTDSMPYPQSLKDYLCYKGL